MNNKTFGIITIALWAVFAIGWVAGIPEARGFAAGGLVVLAIALVVQRRQARGQVR